MSFNGLVRYWRSQRGFSQAELAERARLSARHISFLETGRSAPSRDAVLAIGRALDLPDLERRRLLIQAGFAEDWTPECVDEETTDRYLQRLEPMLSAVDPMPAFITSPSLRAISCNRAASAFFRHCLEHGRETRLDSEHRFFDIQELVSKPSRFRRVVSNWTQLAERILAGLYRQEPDPERLQPSAALHAAIRDSTPTAGPPDPADSPEDASWIVPIRIDDNGFDFTLDLLALPMTAAWIGYTQLVCLAKDCTAGKAHEYFSQLITHAETH